MPESMIVDRQDGGQGSGTDSCQWVPAPGLVDSRSCACASRATSAMLICGCPSTVNHCSATLRKRFHACP